MVGTLLGPWAPATESHEVWFDFLLSAPQVTDQEVENLARFAAAATFNPGNAGPAIPESLKGDPVPRILFISLSEGTSSSHVVRGSGQGFVEALGEALEKARAWIEEGHTPRWLKLDVVKDVSLLTDLGPALPRELVRNLYGVAFDRESGRAFLPEELVADPLMNGDQERRFQDMHQFLAKRSEPTDPHQRWSDSSRLVMYKFKTASYFSDGKELVQLYRGHRLFRKPTREEVLSAAVAGGRYLSRAVEAGGKFVYNYFPKSHKVEESYNILRHAGTLYSMLDLYDLTGDDALLESAERALDYLLATALSCELGGRNHVCIVEDAQVKLGGNGLAAVALAKYIEITGDREHLADLIAWGRTLRALQHDSGEFIHKITYPEGEDTGVVSGYYPGEALLALVRIYAHDPQEGWLDAAEKGAQYLINVRDQGLPVQQLSHDHWLLYGLNELYRHRPSSLYLDHAMRIAQAIVLAQNREPKYRDWLGSYYTPPWSTPTATRSEGLCAAYQLARDFKTSTDAGQILEALELGIAFQLQTQFRPESVMYLSDPKRSLGGFHASLTNFGLRIDYTQHNISSLLCGTRVLSEAQSRSRIIDRGPKKRLAGNHTFHVNLTGAGANTQWTVDRLTVPEGMGGLKKGVSSLSRSSDVMSAAGSNATFHLTQTSGHETFYEITASDDSFTETFIVQVFPANAMTSFTYSSPGNPDVEVVIHVTGNLSSTTHLLSVHHGMSRTAKSHLSRFNHWIPTSNYIVIAPWFDETNWPGSEYYVLGNMFDGSCERCGNLRPESRWSYTIANNIALQVLSDFGLSDTFYDAWGHSAGGQFVHRWMLFRPNDPIRLGMPANSGWYTAPDLSIDYPYGVNHPLLNITQQDLLDWTNKPMIIFIGENDTGSPLLRSTPEANAQGANRVERASYMYRKGGAVNPNTLWKKIVVPDAEHNSADMAPAAIDYLESHPPGPPTSVDEQSAPGATSPL